MARSHGVRRLPRRERPREAEGRPHRIQKPNHGAETAARELNARSGCSEGAPACNRNKAKASGCFHDQVFEESSVSAAFHRQGAKRPNLEEEEAGIDENHRSR